MNGYILEIEQNLDFFKLVWNELDATIAKNGLKIKADEVFQVRVHNDFISSSLIGFNNYFYYYFLDKAF